MRKNIGLRASCASGKGIVLAIPAYLNRDQVLLLKATAEKARLPLLGLVRAPLAAALAAHATASWSGLSVIVDADDHALTATTVFADGEKLWIHAAQSWPQLNLRIWKSMGAALLKANKPIDAILVYKRDLEITRENGWSTLGIANAYQKLGDANNAAKWMKRYRKIWSSDGEKVSSSCLYLPGK